MVALRSSAVDGACNCAPRASIAEWSDNFARLRCRRRHLIAHGRAVADRLLAAGFGTADRPIAVSASGERWPSDQTLRPSAEDLLGAGSVLYNLQSAGLQLSVEAKCAAGAFEAIDKFDEALRETSSGQELIAAALLETS